MLIKMHVAALAVDQLANSPVVILKDDDDNHMLPIWIGPLEASAIATELEGIQLSRPMTHDLLKNILTELDAEVQKIVITDLMDNTYYARIFLKVGEKELDIDARPSDSMALALRAKVPILVEEKVLQESRSVKLHDKMDLTDEEKMKELLDNLDPESFKYKM